MQSICRTLNLISNHPSVAAVGERKFDESNRVTVDVTFNINLPSEWRSKNESPSNVRSKEVIRFVFPTDYPLRPPIISLRKDFNRNLPHLLPWLEDGSPIPCVYDGDPAELLLTEGLVAILNQVAIWLERAALGTLIDPEQGWEPVRRDMLHDVLVADIDFLRKFVDRRGGSSFLEMNYLSTRSDCDSLFVAGNISRARVHINKKSVADCFQECKLDTQFPLWHGKSLALLVWPGKHPSGAPILADKYLPETVESFDDLKQRAEEYGCGWELNSSLNLLKICLSGYRHSEPLPMAVLLMARRPYPLIGCDSPLELCPYIIEIQIPQLLTNGNATVVRTAAHRAEVSEDLLARMTGLDPQAECPIWTIVGAGSLGSKIALHLARTGRGPTTVVDRSFFSPHNAARHALLPETHKLIDSKARMLTVALHKLNQTAIPIPNDITGMLTSKKKAGKICSKKTWALVNATASSVVREHLGTCKSMHARVIETSLFSGGKVGIVTIEGPERNPSTTDLTAEFYALVKDQPELIPLIFDNSASISRQSTGQGCGSLTMTMSDGRLSLFAAGMSEYLLAKQQEGLPKDGGEVLIGHLSENGLGLTWQHHRIPRVTVVPTSHGEFWSIHVHSRAHSKIKREMSQQQNVETGGVLMGRISEASKVAHIVDVIEAPEDSKRTRDEFILGTSGLRKQIQQYSETVNWSLYCLGTWHSHLSAVGPSNKDRSTANLIAATRLSPSFFLVVAPDCFYSYTADK